jgi:hypothetical protein
MVDPLAQLLWDAAQKRGGSIILGDIAWTDIGLGRSKGWLENGASIGQFLATDELKRIVEAA